MLWLVKGGYSENNVRVVCFGQYFRCVFCWGCAWVFGGVVRVVWGYKSPFVDVIRGGKRVGVDECVRDMLSVQGMCEVGLPFGAELR